MLRTESRHATPQPPARQTLPPWSARLKKQVIALLLVVLVFWVVELVDQIFFGQTLNDFGIQPRTLRGLTGILLAPFLHGSLGHVAANTLPFLVLGCLVMIRGVRDFIFVTLFTVILGGLGVWAIGDTQTVHVGASGLIFGYLGFLILRGYFDRGLVSMAISLAVGLCYGGLIWGILPTNQEESWEGHLCGFLAGALCARLLSRRV